MQQPAAAYQSFDDFSDDDDTTTTTTTTTAASSDSQEDSLNRLRRTRRGLPKLQIPSLPRLPSNHNSSSNRRMVSLKKKKHKRKRSTGIQTALQKLPSLPPPPKKRHQQRRVFNEFVAPLPVTPTTTTPAKIHSFVPYLRDLEARFEEAFRRKKSSYESVPQIHEYYTESGRQKYLRHSNGDERLANLRQALKRLDTLGYMRSAHQREFHEVFISACLPQLYGKDLDRCLIRILEENDLDSIQSEVMVVTPRRWGKTMAVSLFLAAYLYTQPDADVCVYSIARRTSTMLVLKVYKMVVKLAGGTHVIKRSNQEKLEVVNMYGGRSICNSYPAASKVFFLYISCVCVCSGILWKETKVCIFFCKVRCFSSVFFLDFFL